MHTPITTVTYRIHELAEYINWIYFFHAWGFPPKFASISRLHGCDSCRAMWLVGFAEEERSKAAEAMQLHKEAMRMLNALDPDYKVYARYKLANANADGDNLILDQTVFPLLRQQTPSAGESSYLCLSDYVRPLSLNQKDTVGIFATTVDSEMENLYTDDAYRHMLVNTLCERLAEAAAEKLHLSIRKEIWGYAPHEDLSIDEMLNAKFQGIRPAVGYPSLPDISVNFLLNDLLQLDRIGIELTENAMMLPHASVSGLMFSHPRARYFSVGTIDHNQMADYAQRRHMDLDTVRKYLSANLKD